MKIEIPTQLSNSIRGGSQSTRNMKNPKENLIKTTCKELGLTYRELGERIGYSEATLNKNASTGEISKSIEVAINLYLETLELRRELQTLENLKAILKDLTQ